MRQITLGTLNISQQGKDYVNDALNKWNQRSSSRAGGIERTLRISRRRRSSNPCNDVHSYLKRSPPK